MNKNQRDMEKPTGFLGKSFDEMSKDQLLDAFFHLWEQKKLCERQLDLLTFQSEDIGKYDTLRGLKFLRLFEQRFGYISLLSKTFDFNEMMSFAEFCVQQEKQ
jgi:hypothetical protein